MCPSADPTFFHLLFLEHWAHHFLCPSLCPNRSSKEGLSEENRQKQDCSAGVDMGENWRHPLPLKAGTGSLKSSSGWFWVISAIARNALQSSQSVSDHLQNQMFVWLALLSLLTVLSFEISINYQYLEKDKNTLTKHQDFWWLSFCRVPWFSNWRGEGCKTLWSVLSSYGCRNREKM